MQNFATYCYNNSRVKGFFVYELYDEPAFSYTDNSYVFNRESHFGLIDKHGNKKAMYETVRSLYGGTGTVSGFCLPAAQEESTTVHNFWAKELYFGAYGLNAINSTTSEYRWLPGTFGDSHIMLDSKFDFTKYDYFEFDYYVDNLANFQSRVTSLTVGIVHEDGGHNQTTDFRYLLTQNGWNHVKVPINKGTAEDWVIANAKQFRFKIEMPESTTAAYEIYAIANVCAVKEPDVPVPGMSNTYDTVDSVEGVQHTMVLTPGENVYTAGKGYFRLDKALDTSSGDHIEMDVYASVATDHSMNFWVSSDRESAAVRGKYSFPKLNAGWNHIVIDAVNPESINGSYSFTNYEFDYPFFEGTPYDSSNATGGKIIVANVAVTQDPSALVPAINNTYSTMDSIEGVVHTMKLSAGENPYPSKGYFRLSKTLDTSEGDQIEMDIYVSADMDKASSIWVSSNRESASARGRYSIPKLNAGWNHIVINTGSTISTSGSYTFKNYEFKYPFFESSFFSASHPTGGTVKVANISVTKQTPEINNTYITKDSISGLQHTMVLSPGENPYTSGKHYFRLSKALDTTNADHIEMDVYASAATDNSPNFWVSSDRESAAVRAKYTMPLLNAGWNHIVIDATAPSSTNGSYNFNNYEFDYPFFEYAFYSSSHATGGTIMIANISVTNSPINEIPEMVNTYTTKDSIAGANLTMTLTAGQNTFPGTGAFRLSKVLDTTNADHIEMDVYASAATDNRPDFWVSSDRESASVRAKYKMPYLEEGWNHIVIDAKAPSNTNGSFNFNNYEFDYPFFEGAFFSSSHATGGKIRVANISVTSSPINEIPAISNTYTTKDSIAGTNHTMTLTPGQNTFPATGAFRLSKALDTSVGDYVEMDIYVSEDMDKGVDFWVSSDRESASVRAKYSIPQLNAGWNHVVLDALNPSAKNGSYNFNGYEFDYPFFEGAFFTSEHPTGGKVRIANISVTASPISDIPEINNVYATMDYIAGANHTMTLSPGENAYPSKGYFRLSKTLDTTKADHVEMDIYVSESMDRTASMWVSSNRESAADRARYAIPQLDAGWNHVVIDVNNYISKSGSYVFKGYEFKFPFFQDAFYTSEHPTGGTVRIANISVTLDVVAPTDIMEDNTPLMGGIIEDVTFDEYGEYMFDLEESTDISDAKMIELDVFSNADEAGAVTIVVEDSNGNTANFEFTGLIKGWNHLAVRIADLNQGEDNENDVDLSDIVYVTLCGDADAEVSVANLYAADYVEGDANRDGTFDIKDVVRAKKLAAGATTEGNKLAVSGADYEINAVDLTNLIHSIIDMLFS